MADGAVYKFLMSVDARESGRYLDGAKLRMRERIYGFAEEAFAAAGVGVGLVEPEDRGDGFIAAVDARVPPAQLIGPWLTEMHQRLRVGNEDLARPLGLRVGMHVGPVHRDAKGMAGQAVDLVCRLADSGEAKGVLAYSGRDLMCVVSDAVYQAVVRHGGRFVEPSTYRAARVVLKEGPVTAWFHVPGEAKPAVPGDTGFGDAGDSCAGTGETGEAPPRTDARSAGPGEDDHQGSAARADGAGDEDRAATRGDGNGAGARFDVRADGDSIIIDRGDFRGGTTHFGGRK
jgi:hypothetical protein